MTYTVKWTEDAAAARDALPEDRRALLAKAVDILSEDPYAPGTHAVGDGDIRVTNVAPGMVVDYAVHSRFVFLYVLQVMDGTLL